VKRLAWIAAALFLAPACGPLPQLPAPRPEVPAPVVAHRDVRVALAAGVRDLVLEPHGAWRASAGGHSWQPRDGATLRILVVGGRVVVTDERGDERSAAELLELEPADAGAWLVYAETPYAGSMSVRRDGERLTLVARLDLETYLEGVVPWEIGPCTPEVEAAVEAQAIAARTYAWSRLGSNETLGFDVYADERDQIFRGRQRLDPIAGRAIAATRGLVLAAGAQLAQAYYSSTCGGHTSRIERVWSKPPQPYLCGRRDTLDASGSLCAGSKHFRWTEAWSGAELERTIQETLPRVLGLAAGEPVGALLDLQTLERDESGRVLDLEIRTTTGTYHVRGDSIRWVLKPRDRALLRSILFRLDVVREAGAIVEVVVRGGGNGHGVGMCQVGALEMARRGFGHAAILAHYYPGATLRRAY
jgi:stage II sporulation protein D